jgi:hypothetical protein
MSDTTKSSFWTLTKRVFKWGAISMGGALGIFIVLDVLGFVTVGDAVNLFRDITGEPGVRLVRWAEENYFETRYNVSVWWNGDAPKKDGVSAQALIVQGKNNKTIPPKVQPNSTPSSNASASTPTVISGEPPKSDIPWSPYTRGDGTTSGVYTAQIFPNDKLPDQPVYLAWMDPTQLAFHWTPGTSEPSGTPDGPVDRAGLIPKKDWPNLVAAFNGGYLTIHGHFGAMFDNTHISPPKEGFATAALTKDGKMNIGAWGTDIDPNDKNIVTYRQNLRPIVVDGKVPEDIKLRARGAIRPDASAGDPLEGDLVAHTWRSGIGISKSGAIIFAAGDFLDGELLATALQTAGAERAMQLDVNAPYFCVFLLFEPPDEKGGVEGLVLGPKMTPRTGQFTTSRNGKDFVYVVKRGTGNGE